MNDLDVLSEVKKIMDEKNATTFNVIDVQEATKRIKRKEILRILWIVSISVAVRPDYCIYDVKMAVRNAIVAGMRISVSRKVFNDFFRDSK